MTSEYGWCVYEPLQSQPKRHTCICCKLLCERHIFSHGRWQGVTDCQLEQAQVFIEMSRAAQSCKNKEVSSCVLHIFSYIKFSLGSPKELYYGGQTVRHRVTADLCTAPIGNEKYNKNSRSLKVRQPPVNPYDSSCLAISFLFLLNLILVKSDSPVW